MNAKIAILSLACALAVSSCSKQPQATPSANNAPPAADSHEAMPHAPATMADWAKGAQLFTGLGDFHRPITTSSPEAQKYFDQGMRLMYAFNHDEATRSFAHAAELDPNCAACYWGVSYTVGPNYNLPVLVAERAKVAYEALGLARQHMSGASPVEQALISALITRYPNDQPLDMSALPPVLETYAAAMKQVARKFPKDLDVQTLYAESLMNVHAWKLWGADGKPAPNTEEIVATLESVLKRDPQHPGANHYYVHTIEASPHPEKATASAERLENLMPSAGHLVHMPAHIMQRIGRYEESAEANRRGVTADLAYVKLAQPPDYYPMYTAHNYQFLAYSAAMEGRRAETLTAVDDMQKMTPDEMLMSMPGVDWYVAGTYAARARFGLWDELLAMKAPNAKLVGLTGGYLYHRALALAARGRSDEARSTLQQLQNLIASTPADAPAGTNTVKDVLAVGVPIIQARISAAQGHADAAVTFLRQAVQAEDHLAYNEPRDWLIPTRQVLGAQLLKMNQPAEAETVYRQDLKQNPANGWSLYGLSAALKAQGKSKEAEQTTKEFAAAWQRADVTLTASAY